MAGERRHPWGDGGTPSESAARIMADDGTWTKGDARVCAEFVLSAQAEFKARVAEARAALDAGPDAAADYLRGGASEDSLPPHDHTIEPGEINRRGCRRCEIDRAAQ